MHLVVYNALLLIVFLVALPYYLYKGSVTGKYFSSFRERLGRMPPDLNPQRARSIWVHAVSVGEVLAVRPLLPRLRRRWPDLRLVLSTTTQSGQALARKTLTDVDAFFFAPFDWPTAVRAALDAVNPALLLLVETELWPNLIHEAHGRGTRVAVVNGRLSPRSFPRYRLVRGWLARVLAEVDLLLMQAQPHAERALAIGAAPERVRVCGNLKYDGPDSAPLADDLRRFIASAGQVLWVAGSTVEGEEEQVLAAFQSVHAALPGARLLIAPRRPERFDWVPPAIEAVGLRCVRRTRLPESGWEADQVLLLDSIGELASVYASADVVFVGGSLVARGGHNILEAAVVGKAVVVGPHMENFQEVADLFRAEGALVQVETPERLAEVIPDLLRDQQRRQAIGERARVIAERNRGAADRTLAALAELVR